MAKVIILEILCSFCIIVALVPLSDTSTTPSSLDQQNLLSNVFNIFTTPSTQNAYNLDSHIDDNYVPYRSDSYDHFSWLLLKHQLQNENNNSIISPMLMKLVLALLLEAAGNNTQTQVELSHTLTDIRTPNNLRSYYKKLLSSLKRHTNDYKLDLQAKIFIDNSIEPQQRYAAMIESFYFTPIEPINFMDPTASVRDINAWCNSVTNGKLTEIVNIDNVRDNLMLIVNVIYYQGLWKRQFINTFNGIFYKSENEQIKVDYMEQKGPFYFYDSKEHGLKILRLPYRGNLFSMFILLPNANRNIDDLLKSVLNEELKQMQWMMEKVQAKVVMPKFKFDYKKSFMHTLMQLNIRSIFTNNASLPGLTRGNDVGSKLKVSDIYQSAGVDVNELGTEAYASTVVEIENKFGGSDDIEEFYVNRPFVFFIEEEASGSIMFAGKVVHPFVES